MEQLWDTKHCRSTQPIALTDNAYFVADFDKTVRNCAWASLMVGQWEVAIFYSKWQVKGAEGTCAKWGQGPGRGLEEPFLSYCLVELNLK